MLSAPIFTRIHHESSQKYNTFISNSKSSALIYTGLTQRFTNAHIITMRYTSLKYKPTTPGKPRLPSSTPLALSAIIRT